MHRRKKYGQQFSGGVTVISVLCIVLALCAVARGGITVKHKKLVVCVGKEGTAELVTTIPDDPRTKEEKEGQSEDPAIEWEIAEDDGTDAQVTGNGDSADFSAESGNPGYYDIVVEVTISWPCAPGTGSVPNTVYAATLRLTSVEVKITSDPIALEQDHEDHLKQYYAVIEPEDRSIAWKKSGEGEKFVTMGVKNQEDGESKVEIEIKTPISKKWKNNTTFTLTAEDSELKDECGDEIDIELIKFKRGGKCKAGADPIHVTLERWVGPPHGEGHKYMWVPITGEFSWVGFACNRCLNPGDVGESRQDERTLGVYYDDQSDQCMGGEWRFQDKIHFDGKFLMTGQYVEHLYQDYFINDAQVAVAGAVGGIVDGAQVALRPEKVGAARNGSKLTWNIGLGISSGGPALSVGISIQPGGNPITIAINKSIDGDARAVIKQSSHQAGAPIWETIGVKAAAAVRFMQIIDNDWILAGMAEIEADLQSSDKTIRFMCVFTIIDSR